MVMTRAQFRGYAKLSKTTWEGAPIKLVQTRLNEYHAARGGQRQFRLTRLQSAIDAWWRRHPNLPNKKRSWHKRNAMHMLTDQVELESGRWTRNNLDDLPLAQGVRYRRDAANLNAGKEDLRVGQLRVQRKLHDRLKCADARQTRKLQAGPWSDRLRNADLLTHAVSDQWEGARNAVNPPTLRQQLELSKRVIRKVRNLLPLAPFNNQPAGGPNRYGGIVTSVGHGMQLVEAISEQLVHDEEARIGHPVDFLFLYAATSAAARAVGGGVCTHLMTVTAGVLTTMVPANTEIILWFSHLDHQFCAMSISRRPWILVDPWPLKAYATEWDNNCIFAQPQGTRAARRAAEQVLNPLEENYAKITVQKTCETPYGVPGLLASAYDLLMQMHATVNAVDPGHPYMHMDTFVDGYNPVIPLQAATQLEWGYPCH